jgi:hypothetical protein
MRNLEVKDSVENQENIETTYIKAKGCETETHLEDEEDLDDSEALAPRFTEPTQDPKCLLGQQVALTDENNATETQLEKRPFDINDILDVDSNVINYGQFICGKILGSTLLLSNLGETDQVITLNLNKQKIYDCDEIFGQYNREELPFEYTDGTEIQNSEVDFNCWFIENPVNKELQK